MIVRRKYVGTKPNRVIHIEKIYTIHYFEYIKNFVGLGESHDFWEMVYVDCGLIEVTAGEKVFELRQGEAYFHQPNEFHKIVCDSEFSSAFIVSFSTASPDADFFISRKVALAKKELSLISQILEESKLVFAGALDIMDQTQLVRSDNAPYGGEQVIQMLVEQLLISIIRNSQEDYRQTEPQPGVRLNNEQVIVDTVINILTRNLYNKLTLGEICQQVLFSKSYVEKTFRNSMGYGIIQYFNKLKINEAKRLISEGEHSFTVIAEMLNFSSIHYFSRLFKAYTGMNPSEYARSVQASGLL